MFLKGILLEEVFEYQDIEFGVILDNVKMVVVSFGYHNLTFRIPIN